MSKYAIGVDYGTLSVRALLVNIETGEEAVEQDEISESRYVSYLSMMEESGKYR